MIELPHRDYRDYLGSANVTLTANVCMAVISAMQEFHAHKGSMLAGLTSAFVLVSELTGIPVPDLIIMTKNAMTDGDARLPQFKAAKEFLIHEVL